MEAGAARVFVEGQGSAALELRGSGGSEALVWQRLAGEVLQGDEQVLSLRNVYGVCRLGAGPVALSPRRQSAHQQAVLQLHRFAVFTFEVGKAGRSDAWQPRRIVFGCPEVAAAEAWAARIAAKLAVQRHRPKNLLVFVNPYGGRGQGLQVWHAVAPMFHIAGARTKVVVTERQGHAQETLEAAADEELAALDGIVVVGGDGFFSEVLNGFLNGRHAAPPSRRPSAAAPSLPLVAGAQGAGDGERKAGDEAAVEETGVEAHIRRVEQNPGGREEPQRRGVTGDAPDPAADGRDAGEAEQQASGTRRLAPAELSRLRFGIIPAGSTDTVVISTNGSRSFVAAALHIVLGDCLPLDIARITGWTRGLGPPPSVAPPPQVRYAASFAGYGFYGDVMRQSEAYRWLGPARYDVAGFFTYARHRAYQAEVSYLDTASEAVVGDAGDGGGDSGVWEPHPAAVTTEDGPELGGRSSRWRSRRVGPSRSTRRRAPPPPPPAGPPLCVVNCKTCAAGLDLVDGGRRGRPEGSGGNVYTGSGISSAPQPLLGSHWRTVRGRFQSVGAAVMSCRNDKAPAGISAGAHLADGLLHLILIRECSRADYLRQLMQLTYKGGRPLDFEFVEHHKTPAFTCVTSGRESVWSVDGELFAAHELSVQVFHGLISLFARGPET